MGKTTKKNKQQDNSSSNKKLERLEKKRIQKQQHRTKDYQTNEEKKFAENLLNDGYRIEYIDTDGNCLFRSISDQLHNDQNRHVEIREMIMKYIEDNQEHFQLFIEDDETFTDYLERMRSHGEWGGHQELFAASQVLNINIHVHQYDAPQFLLPAASESTLRKNSTIRDIHLSYHGEYHYNSLKPIAGHVHNNEITQLVETCQQLSLNEQFIFDEVKQSLPWRSDECILNGLKTCQYNFDDTIEYLINDPRSDAPPVEETKEETNERRNDNENEDNSTKIRHPKVKIKKNNPREKKNEPVISKKVSPSPLSLSLISRPMIGTKKIKKREGFFIKDKE